MQDKWMKWLLHHRFGGNEAIMKATMQALGTFRDKVLEKARIKPQDTVLDIGTGDGLIAFGALKHLKENGTLYFTDISDDALAHCKSIVEEEQSLSTFPAIHFVNQSADNLSHFADASVDAVVFRSVLLYIANKEKCFTEFYRVLKPGGRLAFHEPINSFKGIAWQDRSYLGIDLSPLGELADRFLSYYRFTKDDAEDPMTNFDERDLFRLAEEAGFENVEMEYWAGRITKARFSSFDAFLNMAPNPMVPVHIDTLNCFPAEERELLYSHLKKEIEQGTQQKYLALCLFSATK